MSLLSSLGPQHTGPGLNFCDEGGLAGLRVRSVGPVSPQGAYSAFVYSYAVEKPLSVGHKVAGYLPSLFWGFITLGRLISIPISSKMKPATMVFINVVSGPFSFLAARRLLTPGLTSAPRTFAQDWTQPPGWKRRRVGRDAAKEGTEIQEVEAVLEKSLLRL